MLNSLEKLPHPQSFPKGEGSVNMMVIARERSGSPSGLGAVERIKSDMRQIIIIKIIY